jgi:sporulation protein YlmC with PRC-barrel domain
MAWATLRVNAARVRKTADIIIVERKLKRKKMKNWDAV